MAETTDRGSNSSSLSTLEKVLEEWLHINKWPDWDDDAPWWYGERTSLGHLAGAVWRCPGGWVLEEVSIRKRKSGRTLYPGRCDMAFGLGDAGFWCEAKQCEVVISDEKEAIKKILKKLEEARRDVAKGTAIIEENEGNFQGVMAVFVVPKISVKSNLQETDTYIVNFIEQLQQIKGAALAWTFPKAKRTLCPKDDKDYYYPGVALVLKSFE